ncbi:MAG: hypothetical protein FWD53_03305, partial [Phycisphaerales bacterium]|nr:hypothetical protein [Phycisphaerales bacterium]
MQPATTLRTFLHDRILAILTRYFPGNRFPSVFAGHRITTIAAANIASALSILHRGGVTHIGTQPIPELVRTFITQIDRRDISVFWSYHLADTIAAFGQFNHDNPLLAPLSQDQRNALADATDSTGIYNPSTGKLSYKSNNYWSVLARCEYARQQIGLVQDPTILNLAVNHVAQLLAANPLGFLDDSAQNGARFDTYSFDCYLTFLEPLWHLFDQRILTRNLRNHAALFDAIAMENGANVAWGRSVGAMSIVQTICFAAASLHHNFALDPSRTFALMQNAFDQFQSHWFSDDLLNAHRHKMTFNYRGPHRLFQMTFDIFCKLAVAANQLDHVAEPPALTTPLFPQRDHWLDLCASPTAGVWMFRNQHVAFQLPVI